MLEDFVSSGAAYLILVVSICLIFAGIFDISFDILYAKCRRFRRYINHIAGIKSESESPLNS